MAVCKVGVMIIAEQSPHGIKKGSLQLAGKARQLADQSNSAVAGLLIGNDLSESTIKLFQSGVDIVLSGEGSVLDIIQP